MCIQLMTVQLNVSQCSTNFGRRYVCLLENALIVKHILFKVTHGRFALSDILLTTENSEIIYLDRKGHIKI